MPEINDLPPVPSAQGTDVFPVDQGATTYKESVSQLTTYMNSNVQLAAASQVTGLGTAATKTASNNTYQNLASINNSQNGIVPIFLDSAGSLGLANNSDVAFRSVSVTNPATPPNGGTGVASPTAHSIPVAEGSSNFNFITLDLNRILVGQDAADPEPYLIDKGFKLSSNVLTTQGIPTQFTLPINAAVPAPGIPAVAGYTILLNGSADYTVVIDTSSMAADSIFGIQSVTTNDALVTIELSSGNISGQSEIVVGSGDGFKVYYNGTNGFIQDLFLQPCYTKYVLGTPQNIPTGTAAEVRFDTMVIDQGGFFVTAPDYYWQPKLPGIYDIKAYLYSQNALMAGLLWKNHTLNNEVSQTSAVFGNGVVPPIGQCSIVTPGLFRLNGSSDFVSYNVTNQQNTDSLIGAVPYTVVFMGTRVSLF